MSNNPPFVHLRLHTEYSLVDSVVRVKPLFKRVAELGMPAVAVTDQSNLFAMVKLYKAGRGAGVKPIFGVDLWVDEGDPQLAPSQLVLLCQNDRGYHNLTDLVSRAYTEGQHRGLATVRRQWLEDGHSEGLIALSGGRGGDVGRALLNQREAEARGHLEYWLRLFPDRYYLELHRTGREGEETYLHAAVDLAASTGTPVVATNDVRFLYGNEFEAHEARVCIHDGRTLDDPRRTKAYSEQQFLRSPEQMAEVFADIPEALENSIEIAKRCNLELHLGKPVLPDFPIPAGKTEEQFFRDSAREGLERRLQTLLDPNAPDFAERRKPYDERLETELDVIVQMGFPGYFLIVADFIRWAKAHGIPVGPGRGSGAGSLVAYVLDITDLDPLAYDLLFERFLNPERVSMPDFDIDFCMERRDQVIDYVADHYGRDRVSQIITYGSMAAKAVVRDVGRVLGHAYGFVDQIAKLIPFELGITLDKALEQEEALRRRYEDDEEVHTLIDLGRKLEGLTRNVGKHAGGIVIAPSRITDFSPLYCEPDTSNLVTQFDKDDVEAAGLVKFDFLGLRTLTIIDWAVEEVNRSRPDGEQPLDIATIPLVDKPTFDLLKRNATTAVFQLESRGMKDLIKRLQPDCFEDIVALVALFRPGPLQSGMVDDFVNRKHGRAAIEYPHPDLAPILEPTYGIILYQEQVMQIAQVLAGYSLGGADLLRRCLSGSTQVIDADSGQLVSLEDIAKNAAAWRGRMVVTFDPDTQQISNAPIDEIYPNGIREVWEIRTKTNRRIRATQDHLFYTLNGWQPLARYSVGDAIGLARNIPVTGDIDVSNEQIKLVAYLIGDGYLSPNKPSNSYFCNSDKRLIDDFNCCCEHLFGMPSPVDFQSHEGRKDVYYARVGCISAFNIWIDAHIKRALSRHKEIPDWAYRLPQDQLRLFVGTLWSTDGTFDISIGHADYTSTSRRLVEQLQYLLLRLGVVALFNVKKSIYNGQTYISYRVQVTGRHDMLRFYTQVHNYLSAEKQIKSQLCQEIIGKKTRNQSKHLIPAQVTRKIANAKYSSGMTWREIDTAINAKTGTMSSGLNFNRRPTRWLSRHRVRNFARALQDKELALIADSEIFWDKIVSIEYVGKETVYDLSIPDHHNFIANGFIAHNCMGKKKPEEMAMQRGTFTEGATKRGVDPKTSTYIFDLMEKFAGYGFNKTVDKDTLVRTLRGVVRIEDCRPGDKVFSIDEQGAVAVSTVLRLHDHGHVPLWEVLFDDGTTERCTLDHKWLTRYGQLPLWKILQMGEQVWGTTAHQAPDACAPNTVPEVYGHDSYWSYLGEVPYHVLWRSGRYSKTGIRAFSKLLAVPRTSTSNPNRDGRVVPGPSETADGVDRGFWRDRNLVFRRPIRIHFMGWHQGYDLEVDSPAHNFVLASGLCCSNSHSAAYALVSYQTAWLKAHYPAAFMAAVLSADMDNTDKVVVLIDECAAMKLPVQPPDVNRSGYRFSVSAENGVVYGLGAIKGAGEGAIEGIIEERDQNGPYLDLFDFCRRIDLRKANRRVQEALVRSGALDGFGQTRAVLMASLPKALQLAEQHSRDSAVGQADLFGDGGEVAIPTAEYVDAEDWPERQRLVGEKETLGLYLTGHPIDEYRGELKRFTSARIADLKPGGRDQKFVIAGLVVAMRTMASKRGGRNAFLTLDDRSGRIELKLFGDTYQENRDRLANDRVLVAEGSVATDDFNGGLSMLVEKVWGIDQAREAFARHLRVKLNSDRMGPGFLESFGEALEAYKEGACQVRVHYSNDQAEAVLTLGQDWRVVPGEELLGRLRKLAGAENVAMVY